MNIKNTTLAVFAFTIATGAAIASSVLSTDVYVHARIVEGGPISCVNTNTQCDTSGQFACTVIVPTTKKGTGGSQIATTAGSFSTYASADCSLELAGSPQTALLSKISVYELRP